MRMRLSIVIPTRSRARELSTTIGHFCRQIVEESLEADVELVCVNNFSVDDTEQVCRDFERKYGFFKYFHQKEERLSAETSAFTAIDFASGDYCWIFGDDDTPLAGSIRSLLKSIDAFKPDFILLNMLFQHDDREPTIYMNSLDEDIFFEKGLDFFRSFGLITSVTTMSCLCFRRLSFKHEIFQELSSISEIYSHSFCMFVLYHAKSVLFRSKPALMYVPSHESIELKRIGGHSRAHGRPTYFAFNHGLVRLIAASARMTGVPVSEIARFEEIIIDKTAWMVRHALLWCFIARVFTIEQIEDSSVFYDDASVDEIQGFGRQLSPLDQILFLSAFNLRCCQRRNIQAKASLLQAALETYEQRHFSNVAHICHDYSVLTFQPGVMPKAVMTRRGETPQAAIIYFDADRPPVALGLNIEWVSLKEDEKHDLSQALKRTQSDIIVSLPHACVPLGQSLLFVIDCVRRGDVRGIFADSVHRTHLESSGINRSEFFGDQRSKEIPAADRCDPDALTGPKEQVAFSRLVQSAGHQAYVQTGIPIGTIHCGLAPSSPRATVNVTPNDLWTFASYNSLFIRLITGNLELKAPAVQKILLSLHSNVIGLTETELELHFENLVFLVTLICSMSELRVVGSSQAQGWINQLRYFNFLWEDERRAEDLFRSRVSSPVREDDLFIITRRTLRRMGLRRPNTGLIARAIRLLRFVGVLK